MTDELVKRAMGGDQEAFGVLVTRSLPRLVGIAGLILRRRDAAEDAAQEAIVRAWRDLPSLREPDRFDAWLYRLLIRACHDQRRREARGSDTTHRDPRERAVPDHATAYADRDAIEAGLRRLTVDQRTVIVLRYYLQLSHPEIALAAQIPVGTVKSRINRALSALQAALAADARGLTPERPT